jgi:2-dehydro-3-deoxyphosphogluconate aldolase/(4S)-4-hydroxy-2-oxoglutarate aldolase
MSEIRSLLNGARVMPILTIANAAHAAPLAAALHMGGITTCEVTLRTTAALTAIAEMRAAAPTLIIGAGTIRTRTDAESALKAGAQFLVTPGTPRLLAEAIIDLGAPCLPGAATASEAMTLCDMGFSTLKFFPAEQAGGVALLKALQGPLPDLLFCPTGGITRESAPHYLALANVACVGGSWIAPDALLDSGDFAHIEANAHAASLL